MRKFVARCVNQDCGEFDKEERIFPRKVSPKKVQFPERVFCDVCDNECVVERENDASSS